MHIMYISSPGVHLIHRFCFDPFSSSLILLLLLICHAQDSTKKLDLLHNFMTFFLKNNNKLHEYYSWNWSRRGADSRNV